MTRAMLRFIQMNQFDNWVAGLPTLIQPYTPMPFVYKTAKYRLEKVKIDFENGHTFTYRLDGRTVCKHKIPIIENYCEV